MSAIFGIIKKNNSSIDPDQPVKLRQAIAHRAKDGEGSLVTGHIAFGFCKLTIFPQQINERLPIETGDLILTADAHLHNREGLYSLLNLDKKRWQLEPDSSLILKAYEKWGHACVENLEGEFVFAVWNKVSQKFFMAVDQIGFRPMFYYDGPDEFIFCSEIKGIVAAKTTPNYFNEEHIIEYHFRQSDPAQTYNKEIFALCGGTALVLEKGKLAVKKYWTLEKKRKYNFTNDDEWFACLRYLMYKAVEKRLNPEIPIGITLSGGLDSSSIACILSKLLAKRNKPLYAFSSVLPVGHSGVERDERHYIEIVNKHCPNIIQTFVEAPGLGPFDYVEEAFDRDESIPNSFFYIDQAILKTAQAMGVHSMFSGFGGDFLVSWGGRQVIHLLAKQGEYQTAFRLLKQLSNNYNNSFAKQLKNDYLIYTSFWRQLRKLKPRKRNWEREATLNAEFAGKYKSLLEFDIVADQRLEMKRTMEEGRIGRFNSKFVNREAYYNIGTNTPLFDKELMELLIDMPLHLFVKDGWRRNPIRQAMSGVLPAEIQFRKDKTPYNPDFARRTIDGKDKLYEIMNSTEDNSLFDKYFSKQVITDHFNDIAPHAGFNNPTSTTNIRITQAGISCKTLAYLKSQGYHFD